MIYLFPVYLVASLIDPIESRPHFMKGSKAITGLNGHLPLCDIGSKCWQMS
jgi:hypothetical protein